MEEPANKLYKITEFRQALVDYKPSKKALLDLRSVKFVLLSAPTAAGRNTLIRKLLETNRYQFIISDTTRKPRLNNNILEQDGVEYWFRTEDEFLSGLKNGDYLESAIIHGQQVSGINIREIKRAEDNSKIAITDIDIQGCDTCVALSEKIIPIFILPPSFDEWMRRLDGRGEMLLDEKQRRLKSAVDEITSALERPYFKFVTNWDLVQTSEFLDRHINGYFSKSEQAEERSHAISLLHDLKKHHRSYKIN